MTVQMRQEGFARFAYPGETYLQFIVRMAEEAIFKRFDDEEIVDGLAGECGQ